MSDQSTANLKLKFRIMERYRTLYRFAHECGRNASWISRLIYGVQLPTEEEKNMISQKLRIAPSKIDSYFRAGRAASKVSGKK